MIDTQLLETAGAIPSEALASVENAAGRILLIVNDPMIHLNLSSRLRLSGFEVSVTSGGELAKQKFHSYNPHAVVLDLMVDEDAGDEVIRELRRNPDGGDIPIYAFSSSPAARSVRRAGKSGVTKLFTDSATPFEDIIAELTAELSHRISSETDFAKGNESRLASASEDAGSLTELRNAIARVKVHLEVLEDVEGNEGRAEVYGDLRGKMQTVLPFARESSRPGLYRLAGALHSLLKVLHEMPECATDSTKRTVVTAVEVLTQLCQGDTPDLLNESLDLSAVIGDNDMVSRSVVCSALRSVGFHFECFSHTSLVLPYLNGNRTDLVIVHPASDASQQSDFINELRAKSRSARAPVIIVSGVSDFEIRSHLTVNGIDEVIAKPFIFMELSVKALSLALKKRLAASKNNVLAASADVGAVQMSDAPQSQESSEGEVRYDDQSFSIQQFSDGSDTAAVTPPKLPRSRFKGSAISASVGEGATTMFSLREELEKKRQEREKLVTRIFNNELEMEEIRTSLEEEREHRQQLEQMVQDLMVGQTVPSVDPSGVESTESTDKILAESAAAETAPPELLASLQMRLAEMASEADSLRGALEARQEEREKLATRIYQDELELETIRGQLEQERLLREELEAKVNDGVIDSTGSKLEASAGADAIASSNVELAELRHAQEELVRQLTLAQAENEAEFKSRAELEVRLQELTSELKQAREAQQGVEAERQRLEAEFQQKLTEARKAIDEDQAARQSQEQLGAQLQEELAGVRKRQAELEEALSAAQAEAAENSKRKQSLEEQLAGLQRALEDARIEREKAVAEHTEVLTGLRQDQEQLKLAAEAAEAARNEEVQRRNQLQKELDDLWQAQQELDAQLATEKAGSADASARREELESRLREVSAQLDDSRNAVREAGETIQAETRRREEVEARLVQVQSELDEKLNSQTQLAVEVGEQKADLERRLNKLEEELPLSRKRIAELTEEKETVQRELAAQLKAATQAAETAGEKARAELARSTRLEEELAQNRKSSEELTARLQVEKERAEEALSARNALEERLAKSAKRIEQALSDRQALVEQHKETEARLSELLQNAEKVAATTRQKLESESARARQLTDELGKLWQNRKELESSLQKEAAGRQQAVADQAQLRENLEQQRSELEQARADNQQLAEARQKSEAEWSEKLKAAGSDLASARGEAQASNDRNKNLVADLDRLRETHASLEARLNEEQNALNEARARGDRLETRMSQTLVICDELKARLAAEEEAVANLTRLKEELEQRLNRETRAWTEARQDIERQVADQKRREAELDKELDALRATAEQADAARQKESVRADKFEAEVTQLWQVRDDLKARVASGLKIISDLNQQRAALERQLEEVIGQLEQSRRDLESTQTAKARLDEDNQALAELNASLKSEAAVSAEKQRTHESELASMDRRVRDTLASLSRTAAELESERGERHRMEERAAGLSTQLQDLHSELNSHLELEKENQARLAELEREIAERVGELNDERAAHESERGERRNVEQRAAALANQIETLRQELTERLKLEKENQSRIANLEQQLRVREESLVRVTQHLENEREERRRVEQRAEALIAQTQQLQDQLGQAGQREKAQQNRIVQLEEQGAGQAREIQRLEAGISSERGERNKIEERAQSLSAQLRELHNELNEHLRREKAARERITELEGELAGRRQELAEMQSHLEKETADRELVEEQLLAAGDISAKLKQYQESFEEARKAFEATQRELETRLETADTALRERETSLEQEAAEALRLRKALDSAQREAQNREQQKSIELSKLQSALQVESMERRRLEGDAMHSRYASLQSSRSGRTLVNGFRRQLEKPVDKLMQQARRMLSFEMNENLKEVAEALLESAVTLQNNVRECDVVDLTVANAQSDRDVTEMDTEIVPAEK